MKYTIKEGSNNHVIFGFHGSRSTLEDLFNKITPLDPKATYIGIQGQVHERGATRHFSRYEEGHYNLESLKDATAEFYDLLKRVLVDYKLQNHRITLIGYSNGANLIENLLRDFDNLNISSVVLLHPASINLGEDFKKQEGLSLLLTGGLEDSFLPPKEFEILEAKLKEASIVVGTFVHEGGHEIDGAEIKAVEDFLFPKLIASGSQKITFVSQD